MGEGKHKHGKNAQSILHNEALSLYQRFIAPEGRTGISNPSSFPILIKWQWDKGRGRAKKHFEGHSPTKRLKINKR